MPTPSEVFQLIAGQEDGISWMVFADHLLKQFKFMYEKGHGVSVRVPSTSCSIMTDVSYEDLAYITADVAFETIPEGEKMDKEHFIRWYTGSLDAGDSSSVTSNAALVKKKKKKKIYAGKLSSKSPSYKPGEKWKGTPSSK